jgi:NAD(P)-dependent dehydrogenase (short-subunit alcohol dehydrogenase family)
MIFSSDCLAGRRILVTGASSGLGRDTAVLLARTGAILVLAGRNEERLEQTRASLAGEGHSLHLADLSTAESAYELAMSAAASAPLDGIFHSAGITKVLPVKMVKDKQLQDVFGINTFSAFGLARAVARKGVMVDGGSVVFMSALAAICGRRALSSYCSAKAALDGLVRSLAVEFADRKIRVNSIVSGAVETEMHFNYVGTIAADALADYEAFHPLGFGKPDDIANAAVYLLSDAGRWVTGTSMVVDGGAAAK